MKSFTEIQKQSNVCNPDSDDSLNCPASGWLLTASLSTSLIVITLEDKISPNSFFISFTSEFDEVAVEDIPGGIIAFAIHMRVNNSDFCISIS